MKLSFDEFRWEGVNPRPYKQGELTWAQAEPFGEVTVQAAAAQQRVSA